MERTYSLIHPDLLTITEGERTWRGADQEWFGDEWQRKGRLQPTAAAMLVSYLAQTRPSLPAALSLRELGADGCDGPDGRAVAHVTPGEKGGSTPCTLHQGLCRLCRAEGRADLPADFGYPAS